MITQQLIDFIKHQQTSGKSRDEIVTILRANGWDEKAIEQGFQAVSGKTANIQVVPSPTTSTEFAGPVELLTRSWHVYTNRIWTLLGISILSILMSLPFIGIFVGGMFLVVFGSIVPPASTGSQNIPQASLYPGVSETIKNPIFIIVAIVVALIVFVTMTIIQIWGNTALLMALRDRAEGIGIKESFRRAWGKVRSVWWVAFLTGAIVMGGFMLLVIPGIIFAMWFLFSQYIVVAEDHKGMNALLVSREYVRGKWWGVFGRALLFGIGFSLMFSILEEVLKMGMINEQVRALIISPLSFVLGPLSIIYYYLMYESAKASTAPVDLAAIQKNKTGFTVIAVIGFLIVPLVLISTIILVAINPLAQLKKARDIERVQEISSIQNALFSYQTDNGEYPVSLDLLVPEYFSLMPEDPGESDGYSYEYTKDGDDYRLCVEFEERTPKQQCVGSHDRVLGTFSKKPELPILQKIPKQLFGQLALPLTIVENFIRMP